MSKIKNGGLDQYGAEPFEQQQFGTAGIEGVNNGRTARKHNVSITCGGLRHDKKIVHQSTNEYVEDVHECNEMTVILHCSCSTKTDAISLLLCPINRIKSLLHDSLLTHSMEYV